MTLRKVIKTRGSFPNEESALKLLYLALRSVAKEWHTIQGWPQALNRFAILWEDRFPERARQGPSENLVYTILLTLPAARTILPAHHTPK